MHGQESAMIVCVNFQSLGSEGYRARAIGLGVGGSTLDCRYEQITGIEGGPL